ncbi:MAG: hypothetical protein OEW52_02435 [Thermoleophilia bacterium]|nr:hypothetical protein [Thermoleophilia bacterium]MDH4339428.1 hypothetical protein [Thermoleophilia bacterium]MDH5279989.1 hypothetical protein [Thermoleophilia bacterium]
MGTAAEQRIALGSIVVDRSEAGARKLGDEYLGEIGRATRGLVSARATREGVELRLARRITLFDFDSPALTAGGDRTACRFEIRGGLLVARPGGSLTITQHTRPTNELIVAVEDYAPRLDPGLGRRGVGGFLYAQLQERAHAAVGRRYLERMTRGRS